MNFKLKSGEPILAFLIDAAMEADQRVATAIKMAGGAGATQHDGNFLRSIASTVSLAVT